MMRWLATRLLWAMSLAIGAMAIGALFMTTPAHATPSQPMRDRADQLVALLKAPGGEEAFFSPVFLDAVPVAQWRALAERLRRENGAPQALRLLQAQSASIGAVEIAYADATLGFQMVVAPQAPYQVIGLRLTGTRRTGDNLAKVSDAIAALPGHAAFTLVRLTKDGPLALASHDPDRAMATGSSFKLAILAELTRAITAKERRWSDVIPLAHKSFSGRLSTAPDNAPMTLHSLALAMIAESDNSAADTLLLALGRDRIDAMVPASHQPVLTTAEAFALKMPLNGDLRAHYATANSQEKRSLLRANAARLTAQTIDVGTVAATPIDIDTIEWFASPNQMIALLDRLRQQGDAALPILAVNPGITPGDAARWAYLGYKGGSEPGVIAMNFLARANDGHYYALAAAWNDPTALVNEDRFVGLMSRMLTLVAEDDPR